MSGGTCTESPVPRDGNFPLWLEMKQGAEPSRCFLLCRRNEYS